MVNINNGDCVVEVEFDVGTNQYKIVRGIINYMKFIRMVMLLIKKYLMKKN